MFAWHAAPGAFERLVPPWERARVLSRSGPGVSEGTTLTIGVPVGPFTLRWVARHGLVVPGREFSDEQVSGPFSRWRHVHRFLPDPSGGTLVEDAIEYALPFGPLGRPADRFVRARLRRMFDYRHEITRADLERHRITEGRRLRVAVSGASGLVGSALAAFLTAGGHEVVPIVRSRPRAGEIGWNPEAGTIDAAALEGLDGVVHLAGENIAAGRWSAERRRRIRDSRVEGTALLARAIAAADAPPKVFVSASAVGYYGSRDDAIDEGARRGSGFLASVCADWEAAAAPVVARGIRTVFLRFGVVLSPRGGALAKMLPAFLFGAGGPIGSGRQGLSWVSLDDAVGAIHFALGSDRVSGPVNVTAPHPVPQGEFAAMLGRVLRRPAVAPLPAFVVRALFGAMGEETLLASQFAMPRALEAAGFRFRKPDLESALRLELGRSAVRP